jgi:hypothetical protein
MYINTSAKTRHQLSIFVFPLKNKYTTYVERNNSASDRPQIAVSLYITQTPFSRSYSIWPFAARTRQLVPAWGMWPVNPPYSRTSCHLFWIYSNFLYTVTELQTALRNLMNMIKQYGKQNSRYSGSIVVEIGNNNHWKTERESPHTHNVASLLQQHLFYSKYSKLRYSNYKKPTPKMFYYYY